MDEDKTTDDPKKNPDPLTGAPGARPVATGVGATGGGLAGMAVGAAVGGPVGAAVGAVIGGVAGGYAGKGVAEAVDPTIDDKYWREHHQEQEWADENSTYEHFEPAYRTGYQGAAKYQGRQYEEVEADLQRDYEAAVAATGSGAAAVADAGTSPGVGRPGGTGSVADAGTSPGVEIEPAATAGIVETADDPARASGTGVPWTRARPALRAAWHRAVGLHTPQDRTRGMRGGI